MSVAHLLKPSALWLLLATVGLEATAAEPAVAGGKPTIHNYVGIGDGSERAGYAQVKAIYGKKFKVVDFGDERAYTRSKNTTRIIPRPLIESSRVVEGHVRVVFIVTAKGRVVEPFVLSSTNKKLNRTVLDIITHWRGTPARLNGAPISIILAQDFTFVR